MDRTPRILIVDDDVEIRRLTKTLLQDYGFLVTVAGNGREMAAAMNEWHVDLVVLDVLMPGQDGFALCRELRTRSEIPIVLLTALREESDRIVGLELGADDYMVKPFNPRELVARIRTILRRSRARPIEPPQETRYVYRFGGWQLDAGARELHAPDAMLVTLSAREFSLLLAFLSHPRCALSRDRLADAVRGQDCAPFDRSIDILVSRLRRKLEDSGKEPTLIKTIRGEGYQFCAEVTRLPADATADVLAH
ncbi:MAG TPA: response regulator [Piscinibacter sp.]|jgi:two-component system OmpR family response regulator|uniref:response regulator n=1 Tax=Piscinibacter sp. TaxID=1903157 RepID=UPI001DE25FFC|nr:response regulator [Piscinibacter sp.]MBK7531608.1 response regulator [Piscinibacter sp.]HOY35057.1 response regulator [Piscinibacter sp.]HPG77755.1 response regulator [Piscinibacter sp.]HPM65006.1 response regulator [Piscinibacter sp.]